MKGVDERGLSTILDVSYPFFQELVWFWCLAQPLLSQCAQKHLPIAIGFKNRFPAIPSTHHMVARSGIFDSRLSWHSFYPPAQGSLSRIVDRPLWQTFIESIRIEPVRIAILLPMWRAMAQHLLMSPRWMGELDRNEREVWQHIFLYGATVSSAGDKDHMAFVEGLRDLFTQHVSRMGDDAYEQSALLGFLMTESGKQLLVEALERLSQNWSNANYYFWEKAVETGRFESFLRCAWLDFFPMIRTRPEALKAFKILTLNLAAQHIPIAFEVQNQLGAP